jgi:putative copper export protein
VTVDQLIKWVHLLAAAVWTGGLITLGALVAALRRAGASKEHLRAAARAFGRLSWSAMAVAVLTGLWQVDRLGYGWSDPALIRKVVLVGLVIVTAAVHQRTARRSRPAVRETWSTGAP